MPIISPFAIAGRFGVPFVNFTERVSMSGGRYIDIYLYSIKRLYRYVLEVSYCSARLACAHLRQILRGVSNKRWACSNRSILLYYLSIRSLKYVMKLLHYVEESTCSSSGIIQKCVR